MTEQHIPYSELVASADGELQGIRAAEVRAHLVACWSCRTRMKEIEDTIAQFVHAHQEAVPIGPIEGPLAMLRARLAELAMLPPPSWRDRVSDFFLTGERLAYLGGGMAAVAGVLFVVGVIQVSHQTFRLRPDPRITPGMTIAASEEQTKAQICPAMAGAHGQPVVSASVGREVFDRYGIERPQSGVYELDYLIPPELGGAADPRNYWPQPFSAGEWNAHAKDALEDRLHQLVCGGEISLAAAQHEIASDWVGSYKKHFRTSGPLASHRGFTKDSPWQP